MSLIELREESAGYDGVQILRGVSLKIDHGERVAFVGESGAGKTTLLRLIYDRLGQEVALMPQDLGLVQALTVFHNVYMGRLHRHSVWRNLRNLVWPARDDVASVRTVLERLRLEDKMFTTIGALSGGQAQRTGVGRALYHPGEVMIADEPVSAVDEHQAREILGVLTEVKKSVILSMHDRALAIEFADRLIGLKDGRVVLDAPSAGMRPGDLDALYVSDPE